MSAYECLEKCKNCEKKIVHYLFKGTNNVGTYAIHNEVVSIADLVTYRNVLIINLVSSRKQPCTGEEWRTLTTTCSLKMCNGLGDQLFRIEFAFLDRFLGSVGQKQSTASLERLSSVPSSTVITIANFYVNSIFIGDNSMMRAGRLMEEGFEKL